ncbi:MAG: hypothetical protein DMG46_23365, partial [Acidobacteria bacterium]
LKNKLAEEKLYLEEEIRSEFNFEEIIGDSSALKRALAQVELAAPAGTTVLLLGETGTGKEVFARAIHNLSPRRERTFVKVNCAAIPSGLLESELFGHEKGAFTGAMNQKIGRFELADRGTLFLDEVGDLPLDLQPKLLRVLQEQEFERLGSNRTQRVDVRVVAATHQDLAKLVSERAFRSDLYYRLNVFPIQIPALRERPEDVPLLVRYFVQIFSRRLNKDVQYIPADIMDALSHYSWPGNVRELENLIERAVLLSPGKELRVPVSELKATGLAASPAESSSSFTSFPSLPSPAASISTLEEAERQHILRALKQTQWRIAGPKGAAVVLGMKRTTLQARMRKAFWTYLIACPAVLMRPLLAGAARLVEFLQSLNGSRISLLGRHHQKHARLRTVLGHAISLDVEFGELQGCLAVAGLHRGPQFRWGPGGRLSLTRNFARMRLSGGWR